MFYDTRIARIKGTKGMTGVRVGPYFPASLRSLSASHASTTFGRENPTSLGMTSQIDYRAAMMDQAAVVSESLLDS